MDTEVRVRRERLVFPTYEPAAPDKNPMFLENRVYQGSSGRVYPLPVIDRIADHPTNREWDGITVENGLVSVTVLPEIGGRIHIGQDLTNGYDFFYRQRVIKPALVGLAGPWASGGVEFNWPQHHRPSTFMPTDVEIEHGEDGSITVWMSEHEPMNRMKGVHGVCLHPGRSVVELKVRLYNRTPYVQTFLWWTNIAIHVHEEYRSFFPPDVHTVADHAKRATSRYPHCDGLYYGVDYGRREREGVPEGEEPISFIPAFAGGNGPAYSPDDLSWYANIPVPTSYMCVGTQEDFVGGYDFRAKAGLIHVADHHIAPGKKQWTWGNQEFGYAWDRNLTDEDGPYIELMAGVYTDNQPDFSFLGVGETKSFSQFWYPYRNIGPAQFANVDAAIGIVTESDESLVGVAASRSLVGAKIAVSRVGQLLDEWIIDLSPDRPFEARVSCIEPITVSLRDSNGIEVARYENLVPPTAEMSNPAVEPAMPPDIGSSDELFLIGLHLDQYRHATRDPALYWREGLRRDPGDLRCNNAMGLWHLRRGEFEEAANHFRSSIARATERNPNPYDGEPYYNLGLSLRFLGDDDGAYDAFAKAVWSSAWQSAGYHALAELDCCKGDWIRALDRLDRSLHKDSENFRATSLKAIVLRKLGRGSESEKVLEDVLSVDPLDHWARHGSGRSLECDNAVKLDLAIDGYRAGLYRESLEILDGADVHARDGTGPLIFYYRAFLLNLLNESPSLNLATAQTITPDYCFPARLEDILVLEAAIRSRPEDARAHFYLGNLFYDRRRHREAIERWEESVRIDSKNSVAFRNLGIGYFNIFTDTKKALNAFDRAAEIAPDDARIWFERDQLWKRLGFLPGQRLAKLRERMELVLSRDDLLIEYCNLLCNLRLNEEADQILGQRKFQPWEGGEGQALGVFSRTKLALANRALAGGNFEEAQLQLEAALSPPHSLGEARHLLANASNLWLSMGDVQFASGRPNGATKFWTRAAEFRGDFQDMSVRGFSELTYFQAIALRRLGRAEEAETMLQNLGTYAAEWMKTEAKIDYFATSLPTMLLFNDDLQKRQTNSAELLHAQSLYGLGHGSEAREILERLLATDPNYSVALDLMQELEEHEKDLTNRV